MGGLEGRHQVADHSNAPAAANPQQQLLGTRLVDLFSRVIPKCRNRAIGPYVIRSSTNLFWAIFPQCTRHAQPIEPAAVRRLQYHLHIAFWCRAASLASGCLLALPFLDPSKLQEIQTHSAMLTVPNSCCACCKFFIKIITQCTTSLPVPVLASMQIVTLLKVKESSMNLGA